jgi:ribonucleoside-diphosphate reductase alpha chain
MQNNIQMRVTKRNGQLEELSFDKILNRIRTLGNNAGINVNYQELVIKVVDQLYDTIPTTKIDEFVSEHCIFSSSSSFAYGELASRIVISNHQKNTEDNFVRVINTLYDHYDQQGTNIPLIDKEIWAFVNKYGEILNGWIDHERDYLLDFFGFKTLERAYLIKKNKKIIERPQHMWMRVSLGIHVKCQEINKRPVLELIKETYDFMSQKYFTHATPTLFNAGTPTPQLSSCFLVAMEEDSLSGIYDTLKDCAIISKYSGGIGLHVHNVRANGSIIRGTNGTSEGLVPMLRVFNMTARYANQSGKRKGSFAIYLEPWHADLMDFLQLRRNQGNEDLRARDLFYALWIPDLFMERVKQPDAIWSFFSEDDCPGLSDAVGEEFKRLYESYEKQGKARNSLKARVVWQTILDSQIETGTPYMLYKDACNLKSNQRNLGTIKSSNLCTEIVEYSDKNETAVCNLASISLPAFVNVETKTFDYKKLLEVTKVVTNNLNNVIDINMYPTEKTRRSNLRHRPIGSGIQGLADVFAMMDIAFHSEEARKINRRISETMYYGALQMSNELAKDYCEKLKTNNLVVDNNEYEEEKVLNFQANNYNLDWLGTYPSFPDSPASQGKLQFDLWGFTPGDDYDEEYNYDWNTLKESIKKYGLRNSLLIAPMPTASTSQILGNNECFEPFTNNLFSRRTLAGDFVVANKYLMKDLIAINMWNEQIKNNILANNGSIQHLTILPEHIRNKYKTVWEIPMKFLIDMSADRGPFICQSQSLNLYMETPSYTKLTSMHFYAWEKGLKTGLYYLRTRAKHKAQQFTIEPEQKTENVFEEEVCEMCSA